MENSLSKDQSVELSLKSGVLKKIMVGAGWNAVNFDGQDPIDIDLSCFLLGIDDMTREDKDFIYFNNIECTNKSVVHKGDNRSGIGSGDDEIIYVDLDSVDYEVASIVFVASIYEAGEKEQDFSMVKDAYIRAMDEDSREEIVRFNMAEDFPGMAAVKLGALERAGDNWYFKALGEPIEGGLAAIAKKYGMLVVE